MGNEAHTRSDGVSFECMGMHVCVSHCCIKERGGRERRPAYKLQFLDSPESPEKGKEDQKVNVTVPLFIHYSTAISHRVCD